MDARPAVHVRRPAQPSVLSHSTHSASPQPTPHQHGRAHARARQRGARPPRRSAEGAAVSAAGAHGSRGRLLSLQVCLLLQREAHASRHRPRRGRHAGWHGYVRIRIQPVRGLRLQPGPSLAPPRGTLTLSRVRGRRNPNRCCSRRSRSRSRRCHRRAARRRAARRRAARRRTARGAPPGRRAIGCLAIGPLAPGQGQS